MILRNPPLARPLRMRPITENSSTVMFRSLNEFARRVSYQTRSPALTLDFYSILAQHDSNYRWLEQKHVAGNSQCNPPYPPRLRPSRLNQLLMCCLPAPLNSEQYSNAACPSPPRQARYLNGHNCEPLLTPTDDGPSRPDSVPLLRNGIGWLQAGSYPCSPTANRPSR